jgi:uncharacterized protein (TIGR03437 family)
MKPTSRCWMVAIGLAISAAAWGQTFGRVVALGGHSSDLALDEARRVVYVANFTANRVDVVSLDSGAVTRSMNVAAQPSSLSMSRDGRYLVVSHYGNFVSPSVPKNALTVINLVTNGRQTFALADPPLGVAFGADGRALVVTTTQFILFEPSLGTMQVLDTIAGVTAKTLPQPPANFPTQIVGASVAASGDGLTVYGVTDTILFSYDVVYHVVRSGGYVASPPLGPRTVSVSQDGSYYLAGWAMLDRLGTLAQFRSPTGELNIGSHAIDSAHGIIYAQIPEESQTNTTTKPTPFLMVTDADNLRIREKLRLPENLSGKGVLSSDGQTMYALSESGMMILPVGSLNNSPRLAVDREDLVFRSNFCNRGVIAQPFVVYDPSGAHTPFKVTSSVSGIRISPSSGQTPAVVQVSVDPSQFMNQRGTVVADLTLSSTKAVNMPSPVRALINLQDPDQRGTFVNVPGTLVDIMADPQQNRFFVLRQDTNEVLVFDGATYQQVASLRTGNTPTSLAITFDRRYLLVGNDNSQIANVFDLETLAPDQPIRFPFGHYPRWLAASGNAILAATRVAGPQHKIDHVDFWARTATELPTLGVYENNININTALVASTNGSSILAAEADGNLLLYDANADTFTISRKDTDALAGAVAASNFDQFVVGNTLYNASLVPEYQLDSSVGTTSGFAFIDQYGFRTGAPAEGGPGIVERVDLDTGESVRSTRMVEAPVTGTTDAVFTRTVAVLANRSAIVNLTTSGFTVLPWNYDASVAVPQITRVVNAADGTTALAPGGLISVQGTDLSPTNIASSQVPLPVALGDSCLTVNGMPVPMLMVSSTQINAQLPFQAEGNVTMVLRTPGGVSDNYNLTILPYAPSVFHSELAPGYSVPLVVRTSNGLVSTPSNPLHWEDEAIIYLTGMGATLPAVTEGQPAPSDPPAVPLVEPTVDIDGYPLPVFSSSLSGGQIGVYEIHVKVPRNTPKGLNRSLRVTQGGYTTSAAVRVVE